MDIVDNSIGNLMVELQNMSPEQLSEWAMCEPDPQPLTQFNLASDAHRRAFLREYYWIGETALFEAVSHVWASLAEPRIARCTRMGLTAGCGGTGKSGLVLMLKKFLAEALAVDHPLPDRAKFDSLGAWHQAAMATFAVDEAQRAELCAKYAAILDGTLPLSAKHQLLRVQPSNRRQNGGRSGPGASSSSFKVNRIFPAGNCSAWLAANAAAAASWPRITFVAWIFFSIIAMSYSCLASAARLVIRFNFGPSRTLMMRLPSSHTKVESDFDPMGLPL